MFWLKTNVIHIGNVPTAVVSTMLKVSRLFNNMEYSRLLYNNLETDQIWPHWPSKDGQKNITTGSLKHNGMKTILYTD